MCQSFIILIISAFLPVSSLLSSGITIDIDKGVIFEHIGYYSEETHHEIFHIFVPFNHICLENPSFNLCRYVQSMNNDIEEIGILPSATNSILNVYDQQSISTITKQDLGKVLVAHDVKKFLNVTKSLIYYVDDHFYLTTPDSVEADDEKNKPRSILYISKILQQIEKRNIGYEFLTENQTDELFSIIMFNKSNLMDLMIPGETKRFLIDMIIGQSVFILKHCSINGQTETYSASGCLAVSTLMRNVLVEKSALYHVYRLVPLPIFIDTKVYAFENIPEIFAYHPRNEDILIWEQEDVKSICFKSRNIVCQSRPIIVRLSSLPCLSAIINSQSLSIHNCQLSTIEQFQMKLLHIANAVWYFYSPEDRLVCHIGSSIALSARTILIEPPMLIYFSCDEEIRCTQLRLPALSCTNHGIYVKEKTNITLLTQSFISISLSNMTDRIVSLHYQASRQSLIRLDKRMNQAKTMIDKYLDEFITGSASLFFLSVAVIFVKFIRKQTMEKLDKLQVEINRLQRDCIPFV